MSYRKELLDWFDAAVARDEKSARTRKIIQQEQQTMEKTLNKVSTLKTVQQRGEVLTDDQWRVLLTSGKSRRQISTETGCIDRTIRNRATLLNLPVPPSTCRPQSTPSKSA